MNSTRKSWTDYDNSSISRPEDRYVDEAPRPQQTGLVDSTGRLLYRMPNPIGFETDPTRRFK